MNRGEKKIIKEDLYNPELLAEADENFIVLNTTKLINIKNFELFELKESIKKLTQLKRGEQQKKTKKTKKKKINKKKLVEQKTQLEQYITELEICIKPMKTRIRESKKKLKKIQYFKTLREE
jgi:hypothetical protein